MPSVPTASRTKGCSIRRATSPAGLARRPPPRWATRRRPSRCAASSCSSPSGRASASSPAPSPRCRHRQGRRGKARGRGRRRQPRTGSAAPPGKPTPGAPSPHPSAAAPAGAAAGGSAKELVGLTVEGAVENAGHIFESFRVRYRLPAPAAGQPVTSPSTGRCGPAGLFVLRLKIRDEGSGAEALRGARLRRCPGVPIEPPMPVVAGLPVGEQEKAQRLCSPPRDTLTLVPPDADVVLGLWRAEALVTGNRIAKVVFSVDGKPQFTRNTAPYTVELRLKRLPTEQVVRAEGYDAQGESDRLRPAGAEPAARRPPGDHPAAAARRQPVGRIEACAEVTVPSERRVEAVEFRRQRQAGGEGHPAALGRPASTCRSRATPSTSSSPPSSTTAAGRRTSASCALPTTSRSCRSTWSSCYTTVTDGAGQLVRGLTARRLRGARTRQAADAGEVRAGREPAADARASSSTPRARWPTRSARRSAPPAASSSAWCAPATAASPSPSPDRPVLRMPLTDDPRAAAQSARAAAGGRLDVDPRRPGAQPLLLPRHPRPARPGAAVGRRRQHQPAHLRRGARVRQAQRRRDLHHRPQHPGAPPSASAASSTGSPR